jgi:hypothetical protein
MEVIRTIAPHRLQSCSSPHWWPQPQSKTPYPCCCSTGIASYLTRHLEQQDTNLGAEAVFHQALPHGPQPNCLTSLNCLWCRSRFCAVRGCTCDIVLLLLVFSLLAAGQCVF